MPSSSMQLNAENMAVVIEGWSKKRRMTIVLMMWSLKLLKLLLTQHMISQNNVARRVNIKGDIA
jgi:hypothetical protein